MKKILTVLLAAAMMIVAPVGIFADSQDNVQELTPVAAADKEGSVKLKAEIVSSYTLKLPKEVDVSNASTTVDIYAKGDVDGSKKIVIEEKDAGTHVLADAAGLKTDTGVTVAFGSGIAGSDILAEYSTAKDTMTITHDALLAGSWSCELPIVIKLANIAN